MHAKILRVDNRDNGHGIEAGHDAIVDISVEFLEHFSAESEVFGDTTTFVVTT